MTKTSKTSKTSKTAIVYDALSFARAGFRLGQGDAAALEVIRKLAEKNQKDAREQVIVGYVAGRQNPAAAELTEAMRLAAIALVEATGHTSKGKVADGSFRRSAEQEKLYAAARQVWSRLARAAGIVKEETRGGARARAEEKPAAAAAPVANKPEEKQGGSFKIGAIKSAKDAADGVHTVKTAWAALMVMTKPLTLPTEASDLAVKITTMLNQLEGVLAKAK